MPRARSAGLFAAGAALAISGIACSSSPPAAVTDGAPQPTSTSSEKSPVGTSDTPFIDILTRQHVRVDTTDPVQRRILADYGSVFATDGGAVPPPSVVFDDDRQVSEWQAGVPTRTETIGGTSVTLQTPAMEALMAAIQEARAAGLDITPRGTDAARRSYDETVRLWRSRVDPGLDHWVKAGKLAVVESDRIRRLSPRQQVPEILALEAKGLFFSTDFSKSILYSVAAPGTSQHLSMLALDVAEHETAKVREILARHGWYQTVATDLPHFTFLGVGEEQLAERGLEKRTTGGRTFWVPSL